MYPKDGSEVVSAIMERWPTVELLIAISDAVTANERGRIRKLFENAHLSISDEKERPWLRIVGDYYLIMGIAHAENLQVCLNLTPYSARAASAQPK